MAIERSTEPWSLERTRARVRLLFLGKGYSGTRTEVFRAHTGTPLDAAWAKQIHGADVIQAVSGHCGEGDALVTRQAGLPLSIATADCVPILLYSDDQVAAIHAGWRGLVAGVVDATLDRLDHRDRLSAWIGPAIGPCCYEVSWEVANEVAAASSPEIIGPGAEERPHIDLVAAARHQLRARGVRELDEVPLCTRCEERSLWSYRRDGPLAGRNLAYAWIERGDR